MALAEARNPYRDMNNAGSIFNAYFATSEQIPSLLIAMHAEFQKVLGVSDEGVKG
jgi:redox-regulated HSP33 family molecular chaperone